jgi:hypothetical protein
MDYVRPKFESDFPLLDFLRKPIKESALVGCLREIWSRLENKQKIPLPRASSGGEKQHQVYPLKILVVEGKHSSLLFFALHCSSLLFIVLHSSSLLHCSSLLFTALALHCSSLLFAALLCSSLLFVTYFYLLLFSSLLLYTMS